MIKETALMLEEDIATNRTLGKHGAALLKSGDSVLTHCNAGALCAVGFGTALGVIRAAVEDGKNIHVIADETRPRLQGMKLTAWELQQDGIPVTIIADNMAAALMRDGAIVLLSWARIVLPQMEMLQTRSAHITWLYLQISRHSILCCRTVSTIDMNLEVGSLIPIEERLKPK